MAKGSGKAKSAELGPLENAVMKVIWESGESTADEVRRKVVSDTQLKDSTIRTVLRRLEAKGFLSHRVEGRTFVYFQKVARESLAARAVKGIADRFFQGSVSDLLLGMANDRMVTAQELKELAEKVKRAAEAKKSLK